MTGEYAVNEIRMVWTILKELRAARRAGQILAARELIEELEAVQMHTENAKLRERICDALGEFKLRRVVG